MHRCYHAHILDCDMSSEVCGLQVDAADITTAFVQNKHGFDA